MPSDETLLDVASRQVRAVLHRWDPAQSTTASLDAMIAPILAALTFEPSVGELAGELGDLIAARLRVRPSKPECLAAARDLIDAHRLLSHSVIDAV